MTLGKGRIGRGLEFAVFTCFAMMVALAWPSRAASRPLPAVVPAFRWIAWPMVRVCERSAFPPGRIEAAMAWWRARGAHFAGPVTVACSFAADGTPLNDTADAPAFDTITVARLGQLSVTHRAGETLWSVSGEVPRWALVLVPEGALDDLVLEHEFGHALGLPHVDRRGQVMNPRADDLGVATAGIRLDDGGSMGTR